VNAKETARDLARKWFKACDLEDADEEMLAEMVESALLASWDAAVEAAWTRIEELYAEPLCCKTILRCAVAVRALKGQGGK
jgi:hypothetical protein